MPLIYNPRIQALDANGDAYSGAKMTVFDAGTTDLRQTFSDIGLTTPNANPLIADSAGIFGPFYLAASDVNYKLKFDTAADVNVPSLSQDNIPVSSLDQVTMGLIFYPASAAEDANNVTPVNFFKIYGDVERNGLSEAASAATNTTAITDALASNSRITFPEGTFAHNNVVVDTDKIIQGQGPKKTIMEYTPTSGDGWTLEDSAGRVQFLDIKLSCATTSTGHAIGPESVSTINREFNIDRYEIEGFLKGIFIQQSINPTIGQGRLIGQGKAVAGGFGIKLGSVADTTAVNGCTIRNAFPSSYETNFLLDQGQACQMDVPTIETTDIGILINDMSVQINMPYFDAAWKAFVATTLDAAEASGQTVISVAATTNFATSDPVLIALTDKTLHRSTIASIDAGVSITIDDALPSGASNGADFIRANDLFIAAMGTKDLELNTPTVFVSGSREEDLEDFIFLSPSVRTRFSANFATTSYGKRGSAVTTANFALSAGWGTTATVSAASGAKSRGRFTVTSAGSGQSANPTITYTFPGTQKFIDAPFVQLVRNGGDQITIGHSWVTTTTTVVITWIGTPVAAETYTFEYLLTG